MDGHHNLRSQNAFTLLEVLVACAVLTLVLAMMFSLMTQTSNVWRSSNAKIETFQGARRGFENLTQFLEQATLNTYWDYNDPNNPQRYIRQSELHFLVAEAGTNGLPGTPGTGQAVFFQAPANKTGSAAYDGLTGLINACGFFVQYGSDAAWLPAHVSSGQSKERFRLMQWMEDTEQFKVYGTNNTNWITSNTQTNAVPVADNVIALIIWPKEEGSPTNPLLDRYSYDSRGDSRPEAVNQLPPIMQVALVAIDESASLRQGSVLKTNVEDCLADLFVTSPTETFAEDLKTLEGRLAAKAIPYRIFVSSIPIREAKWSP